jgi:hypothetical protein
MTTSQSPRAPIQEFPGRRRTTSARRVFVALALTLSFVLVLVLTPDATRVQAIGVFDGLRAPGEAAFIAGHRGIVHRRRKTPFRRCSVRSTGR